MSDAWMVCHILRPSIKPCPIYRAKQPPPVKPIRFGAPARQLFAMFHTPSGTVKHGHAVVLCNPFGQEAIRCHRMLRILGERLAAAGFHVMRFDYFGTGDSDGDDDAISIKTWIDNVIQASDEAARLSGSHLQSWFGLRLGATVAALASARARTPPHHLILWDPVIGGEHYLGELARSHFGETKLLHGKPARPRAPIAANRPTEALGFPLSHAIVDDIRLVSAETFSTIQTARSTILQSPCAEDTAQIATRLRAMGVPVDTIRIDTHVVWASSDAMNAAIVPTEPLLAIVNAFAAVP
jgi:uncharacterized protein